MPATLCILSVKEAHKIGTNNDKTVRLAMCRFVSLFEALHSSEDSDI